MRIDIKNKDKVFRLLFDKTNLTKKQLALKLNISFWTLRNWLNDYTIPEDKFNHMIKLCPKIRKLAVYEKLSDTWGASKGGRISFQRKTKKEIMKQVRIMIKHQKPKAQLPDNLDYDFYELYGILMGDGCISKYFVKSENRYRHSIIISGHSIKDYYYHKSHVTNLFANIFKIKKPSIYKIKNKNAIKIEIKHKYIAKFFLKLGFPLGYKRNLKIPRNMINKKEYTNRIIRGLFDTDGCFYARKDQGYKYPHIMITTSSDILRKQLKKLLRNMGYPANIHREDVIIEGICNTNRWFSEIGSSHSLTIIRFNRWRKTGKLLPIGPVDQWKKVLGDYDQSYIKDRYLGNKN